LWVARNEGYFKDENLDVQISDALGGNISSSLGSGQIELYDLHRAAIGERRRRHGGRKET
jgi:hypothetical protein